MRAAGSSYGRLLRIPGAAATSAAALVGRMPLSMLGLGAVLLVQDRRGSYALAGAVSAALALGLAVFGPTVSRLVDRRGQHRVLPVALAVHVLAVGALLVLVDTGAHPVALLLAGALAGAAWPPLGSCVRTRWSYVLASQGREAESASAFALEAVVDEVVFVVGPLLVVAGATLVDPLAGPLLAVLLSVTGTLAFVAQRATEPPVVDRADATPGSVLRLGSLRVLVGSLAGVGVVFGSVEVVMVAFAQERGAEGSAGPLLALLAGGSGLAGLAYGARSWHAGLARRYVLALGGLVLGVLPLLLAPAVWVMAPLALLAGVAVSPSLIASFALVEVLVPVRVRTESFTWLNSGLGLGAAAGAALGGVVADGVGARPGFAVCAAGALLALVVAATGRRQLEPVPDGVPSTA